MKRTTVGEGLNHLHSALTEADPPLLYKPFSLNLNRMRSFNGAYLQFVKRIDAVA